MSRAPSISLAKPRKTDKRSTLSITVDSFIPLPKCFFKNENRSLRHSSQHTRSRIHRVPYSHRLSQNTSSDYDFVFNLSYLTMRLYPFMSHSGLSPLSYRKRCIMINMILMDAVRQTSNRNATNLFMTLFNSNENTIQHQRLDRSFAFKFVIAGMDLASMHIMFGARGFILQTWYDAECMLR